MEYKSLIQPYELLGVATTSTLKEVRKAYHHLALFCHPDQGGDPKDMRMVQAAYEWITAQISKVNTDYTYEIAQQEFDDFVAAQNKHNTHLPSITDVLMESNGLNEKEMRDWYAKTEKGPEYYEWFQRFLWQQLMVFQEHNHDERIGDDVFERAYQRLEESLQSMTKMSVPHGYGSYAAEQPSDAPLQTFPSKQLIIYTEQQPFTQRTNTFTDIHLRPQMDDYSTSCASLDGYDYSLAFTNQDPCLEKELEEVCSMFSSKISVDEALVQAQKEREEFAKNVATSLQQNSVDFLFGHK